MSVVESSNKVKAMVSVHIVWVGWLVILLSLSKRGFIRAKSIATGSCVWALIEIPVFEGVGWEKSRRKNYWGG